MTSFTYTEIIGYIASLVVVSSFLMKNIQRLRIMSVIGCALFIYYGILIGFSVPIIFTNTTIIAINLYYLIKAV
jgi:hypothetical protein